jgi:hypoxanthine-guanine phosphoribosyltransferase
MKEAERNLRDDVSEILISEESLKARTRELAQEITDDYRQVDDLLLICVLKGAFVFPGTISSGAVRIVMDLKEDIAGRQVLIVEDIIDSGRTLDYMLRTLLARSPASMRICSLLSKPSRREVDVPVDYLGFEIPDEFVVGYGLDFGEIYRNLPFIAVLKPEFFAHVP